MEGPLNPLVRRALTLLGTQTIIATALWTRIYFSQCCERATSETTTAPYGERRGGATYLCRHVGHTQRRAAEGPRCS